MSNLLTIFFLVTLSIFVVHSNNEVPKEVPLRKTSASDDYTHEIVSGNCNLAMDKDLVYYKHKDKYGVPLTVRTSDVEYHCSPNQTIYCLKVLNNDKNNKTSAYVYLEQGGYGYNYVKMELKTQRGEGFSFDIFVYAR